MGYDKYYNKVVKLSDLKYVTQENIDTATVNITSADMYTEVHELNTHFCQMQMKRSRFLKEFWGTLALMLVTFGCSLMFFLATSNKDIENCKVMPSMFLYASRDVYMCMIIMSILMFVMFILIYKNKNLNWRIALFMSILLCGVHIVFAFDAVFMPILINMMKKIDDSIKDDVGYSTHFAQMTTSYIRDEESAEDGKMEEVKEKTFDDYKIKPEDDNGYL